VIEDVSPPEHRKPPAGDAAEHLQEPCVAGAVDADRPRDHDLHAALLAGAARLLLAEQLGALVLVAGRERRVLVGRRALDVAVDAGRAAVDDPTHAFGRRGVEDVPGALHVHGGVGRRRLSRLSIGGRHVVHDLDTTGRRSQGRRVAEVTQRELHALGFERAGTGTAGGPDEPSDAVAPPRERAGQVSAREAGGPGDQDVHARGPGTADPEGATAITGGVRQSRPYASSVRAMYAARL
jgi:hypothetical protein